MITDPDRLAELEEERRFLLRSLDDLEREHDAGDVDEHDFATLRDGYVARAAAVLREIDEGKAALAAQAPPSRRDRRHRRHHARRRRHRRLAGRPQLRSARRQHHRPHGPAPTRSTSSCPWRAARRRAATRARRSRRTSGSCSSTRTNIEANTYAGWLIVTSGAASERAEFVDLGIAAAAPRHRDRRHLHRRPLPARRRPGPLRGNTGPGGRQVRTDHLPGQRPTPAGADNSSNPSSPHSADLRRPQSRSSTGGGQHFAEMNSPSSSRAAPTRSPCASRARTAARSRGAPVRRSPRGSCRRGCTARRRRAAR